MCIDHMLLIHSSVDGHLGCFHPLATVNNAAINIGGQLSVSVPVFRDLEYTSRSGIADYVEVLWFTF